jgi:glycerol-3-phosphate dehydrogenase
VSFDLLVIGGGISGAAVALAGARRGLKVLLVERHDFASGASSRSSKLVHGGLRYLKQGDWRLTRESLQAREQLLQAAPGLVQRLAFVMPHRPGQSPGRTTMRLGLLAYDLLAGRRTRASLNAADAQRLIPGLAAELGASRYEDATTDDARLTLRLLQEARLAGAELLNYTELLTLRRDAGGRVSGALLRGADGFEREIQAGCAIATAGAQLGPLATQTGLQLPALRPLRGSHLLLPLKRLPLPCAVAWSHPQDRRPVFAYPWLGALIVGTTDVDQPDPLKAPRISLEEQNYLLAGLRHAFPQAGIQSTDLQCTWAGLRPVITSGKGLDPSKESREHLVLAKDGLIALSGGKLTTFASMAEAALQAAAPWLPRLAKLDGQLLPPSSDGAWGSLATTVRQGERLPHTQTLIGELRHSLQHEQVHHLDDLLLRRTRLGLLQPGFGRALLPALQAHCQQLQGWDAARWTQESERYLALMRHDFGVIR